DDDLPGTLSKPFEHPRAPFLSLVDEDVVPVKCPNRGPSSRVLQSTLGLTVRPGSETRQVYHPALPGPSRAGRFVAVYSAPRERALRGSFEARQWGSRRYR